jgi:hypothetical protein
MTRCIQILPILFFAAASVLPMHAQDRAHELAGQAADQHPQHCPSEGMTLDKCHADFPDGCSAATKPGYDAYLDFLKDQDPSSLEKPAKNLTSADFRKLEAALPKGLKSTNHGKLASKFATLGEGNIHTVIAYLYFAEDTSKGTSTKPANSETCNCKLTEPDSFDYHLGFGFDPKLAASASKHPEQGTPAFAALEKDSVVAEMTPFIRTKHPNWTFSRVRVLEGQQVKIVGQLMADNVHFNKKDDCHFRSADPGCWRSTIWEVHPITQFLVCQAAGGCTASSPDSDWADLDEK